MTDQSIRRSNGLTAWKQVADVIEAEIAGGSLAPGQRLPTEARYAAHFGVNRHTVRRALAALGRSGLIRSAQGSGSFVAAPPLRYPIGERTRFSEIVSRAGREATGDLITSRMCRAEPEQAAALAIEEGAPLLELVLRHRADGIPISAGRTWLPLPRFEGFDRAYQDESSLTRAYPSFGVTDYRRLNTRITARIADPHIAALLELPPARVVLVAESVNIDQNGQRIQATRAHFAAERVELVVDGKPAEIDIAAARPR